MRRRPELILGTTLGRRFALLFVLCAMGPVVLFGWMADRAVRAELEAQAMSRVHRATKDAGTAIIQQLDIISAQLATAFALQSDPEAVMRSDPRITSIDTARLDVLTAPQQERVRAGKPLVRIVGSGASARLELVRWTPAFGDTMQVVIAALDLRRMIGGVSGVDLVPPASRLCVHAGVRTLGCISAVDADLDGVTSLAARSPVFLRYAFGAPDLELEVAESDELSFAPLYRFRSLFIPVAIIALALAALLAQVTIRRQTSPLLALDRGTKQIAAGDFTHRVEVTTDDEFGQLAGAFNGMSAELSRQFKTLALRHDVDVAVLAATSRAEVIGVVLQRIRDVVPCTSAVMLVPRPARADGWKLHGLHPDGATEPVALTTKEWGELCAVPASGMAIPAGGHRSYLTKLASLRAEVYPVRNADETSGALILGVAADGALDEPDRERVRQIVAQMAVAFSNLRLVDELRALNQGTLEALARTTDAASPWTAGHSVRVTDIAVALAEAAGHDADTVDLVRRGALLHDIGKLAVPVAILDKPAALTAEERAIMNTHPEVGARILQPIAAFAPLLPMVRSHHERWDGMGYPDQLRGEEIAPLARLLAVADVAESMLAARPYRAPLPLDYVTGFIEENAGRHFDPHYAQLFVACVRAGDSRLLHALTAYERATPDEGARLAVA